MRRYYVGNHDRLEVSVYYNGTFSVVSLLDDEDREALIEETGRGKNVLYCMIDGQYDSKIQIDDKEAMIFIYDNFGKEVGESTLYRVDDKGGDDEW